MPTLMFVRRPFSVIGASGTNVEQVGRGHVHVVALGGRSGWLRHRAVEHLERHGHQAGMRHPGAVVPVVASRSLSARTFASAASLAAGSFLIGICAAMPPIAWMPRRWQVLIAAVA